MPQRLAHPPDETHDGVLLTDHLDDVAQRARWIVSDEATTSHGESLRDIVEALAYVHDFGKATTYFQQYIDELNGNPPTEQLRYHALIGGYLAYWVLDRRGFTEDTCLAGFVAVARHHGTIPDVPQYLYDRAHRRDGIESSEQTVAEKRQSAVWTQIVDIDEHVPDVANDIVTSATQEGGDWDGFRDEFAEVLQSIETRIGTSGTVPGVDRTAISNSLYSHVLQIWGPLILADKTSAAGAPRTQSIYRPELPDSDQLVTYIEAIEAAADSDPHGTRKEQLNHLRSVAREDVTSNAFALANGESDVATLTLPTGLGKTFTGLSAAMQIRDVTGGDRIIYALPYTSIIDQVVDDLETIFHVDTTGKTLTAHHHLSETTINSGSGEASADGADLQDEIGGMLAESWRAGLTVSTFVQLFESLAGPANRQSMKLPALQNSVVILDEPQSLPLEWWKLVPRLVSILTTQYDATVIAMTATQPRLFDEATELVDDPDAYFDTDATTRVEYTLHESVERYIDDQTRPLDYGQAADILGNAVTRGESTLTICNTIDSARRLTAAVDDQVPNDVASVYREVLQSTGNAASVDPETVADRVIQTHDRSLLHLSTRIRPVDRLTLIETAKELSARDHPLLLVSTQLVEAGVDISFDRVYRDLAPIDSIVQAAGRCNRSFERDEGTVTVWWLEPSDGQSRSPAEAVYNRNTTLLPVAARALESVRDADGSLSEVDVARRAVKTYYDRLHADKDVGEQRYVEYVNQARGDKLGDLSLIDDRLSADVMIVRTESERETIESVREAYASGEFATVRDTLDQTKTLRISVPYYSPDSEIADAITSLPTVLPDEGLYVLDPRDQPEYFDATEGFVVPDAGVEHQFL